MELVCNQALDGNKKVTKSLDPLFFFFSGLIKNQRKKVSTDSRSKGQKGCWALCSPSAPSPPTLPLHTLDRYLKL